MSHYHVVVWLDHAEARVFSFNDEDVAAARFQSHLPHHHVHHKAGSIGSGKAPEDIAYFQAVTAAVSEGGEILIVGPGKAKLELIRYLHRHAPEIEQKLVGVETVDHPSDGQIVAYARHYLRAADRMRPQAPA